MNDLDRFTTAELEQMHADVYAGINARLNALEAHPGQSWLPVWKAGLAAVKEQREHLEAIGAVLRARYAAAAAARGDTPHA